MGPIREVKPEDLRTIRAEDLRKLSEKVTLLMNPFCTHFIAIMFALGFRRCHSNYPPKRLH